jgi:CRISPR system Cascade subunit CasD
LAGLEGDGHLLEEIDAALHNPYFPLFLGRRACPPSGKLSLGIKKGVSLADALQEEWQASDWYKKRSAAEVLLEIIRDALPDEANAFAERDLPLSFEQVYRRYTFRSVASGFVKIANPCAWPRPEKPTGHDALAEVT